MKLRRILTTAAVVFTLAQTAIASDTEILAEQYVNMPEVQQMMDDMFSPENSAKQIASSLPPNITLTDDQMERIGILMSEAMNELRPKMTNQMIESSARIFSADELSALIDFYGSEHGAAIMTKMQPFMQETMGALSADLQRVTQQVTPELTKILQESN